MIDKNTGVTVPEGLREHYANVRLLRGEVDASGTRYTAYRLDGKTDKWVWDGDPGRKRWLQVG